MSKEAFLLGSYLLVRIFLLGIVQLFVAPFPSLAAFFLEFLLYLFTALLILEKKDELVAYHIDRSALFLFIFGGFVRYPLLRNSSLLWVENVVFWGIAVYLLIRLRKIFPKTALLMHLKRWLCIAVLIGIALGIFAAISSVIFGGNNLSSFITRLITSQTQENRLLPWGVFGIAIIDNFSNGAILEEPVFRGFLWGFLKKRGWSDLKAGLCQALLFWFAHIYNIDAPFGFFVTTPLYIIIFSALAWKSRSVTPCIIAHTLYNAVLRMLNWLYITF